MRWAKTGITKAMTGIQPQHLDRKTHLMVDVPIVFDDFVALGAEQGALDSLDLFGGNEEVAVDDSPVRVPPAAHVPRTTASALAALAPPAPKPKVGRPKAVPQRPAGTPDIRGFFSIKKRDRDDDDHCDEIQNLRPGEK